MGDRTGTSLGSSGQALCPGARFPLGHFGGQGQRSVTFQAQRWQRGGRRPQGRGSGWGTR